MKIKKGDYINGRSVEDVVWIDNKKYYLITYFDRKINKPQSKWLQESEVENFVPLEDFLPLRKSLLEPEIKYPDTLKGEPIKECLYKGLIDSSVMILYSPNDDASVCQIGDYWFYFLGSEDEDLTPLEIMESYTKEELTELIFNAMNGLDLDERNYYIALLQEN